MLARVWMVWVMVRDSLWFIPGVMTIAAVGLAFLATQAEEHGFLAELAEHAWIFGGGVEGARGVLGAIAGGLITVTGVVFSVTIVALQLASSQFTPRVLPDFTSDRGNQLVLGVFIGTFTYTLLVLRNVRSGGPGEEPFVPRIGVTLAVVLVLVSIGFLIYFINHSARSIQVAEILDRVSRRTLGDVHRLFPEQVGHADESVTPDPRSAPAKSLPVRAARSGYLQAVDSVSLFRIGFDKGVVIGMEPQIGEFILAGQVLARVSPDGGEDEEVTAAVRTAFVLGLERTPEQDVEFGIIEISDIAVKALSPAINDPTTAFQCIDRLGEILLAFGNRNPPRARRTEDGRVHFIARYTTFERAVGLAFDQIRYHGAQNPAIARKLLATLAQLRELVPEGRRGPLLEQREALLRETRYSVENPADRREVEEAAARLEE